MSAYLSVLTLPDPVQFPMETWEWTIGRDYRDRIAGILHFKFSSDHNYLIYGCITSYSMCT